jgi:large subunit ribosomal protein L24
MAAHIRKGDSVIVIAGSHKGKRGKVIEVLNNRVTIEKVAMLKRHTKANQANPQGGIIEKEGSIHISNVALYDEKLARGTRTKQLVEDGKKVRVGVKSGTKFQSAGI